MPGVLLVMTHLNSPQQADYVTFDELPSPFASYSVARPFLFDDKVRYYGEPVALVVAESFETARDAAAHVDIKYIEGATPVSRVKSVAAQAYAPKTVRGFIETDTAKGDFAAAFAAAPVKIDATYETPFQHHKAHRTAREHGSLERRRSNHLCLSATANRLPRHDCRTLQLPKDKVRVIASSWAVALAANCRPKPTRCSPHSRARLGRPVKTALPASRLSSTRAPHRIDPAGAAGRRNLTGI